MKRVFISIKRFWFHWQLFWSIYQAYNRRRELRQLLKWANRKRLSGVCRTYLSKLADEEIRIISASVRYPHFTSIVHGLHRLEDLAAVFMPRQYYVGYTARYHGVSQ